MNTSLLLSVRVLDQRKFGFGAELGNLRKRNEIVEFLALVLEVEASILES
jgi:hypothetical protein